MCGRYKEGKTMMFEIRIILDSLPNEKVARKTLDEFAEWARKRNFRVVGGSFQQREEIE